MLTAQWDAQGNPCVRWSIARDALHVWAASLNCISTQKDKFGTYLASLCELNLVYASPSAC